MESGALESTPKKWLDLFDTFIEIPKNQRTGNSGLDSVQFGHLFKVFPPVSAWPDLRKSIDEKQGKNMETACLKLLSEILIPHENDLAASLDAFLKSYKEIAPEKSSSNVERFIKSILESHGKPTGDASKEFIEQLDSLGPGSDPFYGYIEVPDLSEMPEAETAALMVRLLDYNGSIRFENDAGAALMAAAILKNPDKVKAPMWELVRGKEDIPLFELFLTKPEKNPDNWRKTRAEKNYLVGLISAGRLKDARDYLVKSAGRKGDDKIRLDAQDVKEMTEGNDPAALFVFLQELLEENPGLNVWPAYLELSARTGKRQEALALLKAAVGKTAGESVSQSVRDKYLEALLANNEVEEAIAFLRSEIVRFEGTEISTDEEAGTYLNHALRLIRIGALLEKDGLVAEGFAAADKAATLNQKLSSYRSGVDSGYLDLLIDHGRFATAEEAVAAELVLKTKTEEESRRDRKREMTQLAYIYSKAGRYTDVIKLLDEGTMWDAGDLSEIENTSTGNTSLYAIVAEAMVETAQAGKALPILKRALAGNPGDDRTYAVLLKTGDASTLEYLEQLATLNPFQERPLIWKAKLLADQGKLEEAEKTVMAGIGIDPSDGEQGSGDRMRAYEILAGILEKRGDGKKSDFMLGVVKAIRISEEADKWWRAGMTGRALEMYEAALKEFSDAYCIQSRLALRYSDLGEFDKAAEHYQRAFELMPSSFGRVESHCFGCEGAFSGKMAQQIAEAVFEELAEKTPDNPQVFYLLGYLRESQGKDADAAVQFARAVELDPLYINAWSHLKNVAEEAGLSAEKQDEIALNIYRLDPRRNDLSDVKDFRKLWEAALEVDAKLPKKETGSLYALPKSEMSPARARYHNQEDRNAPRNQLIRNDLFQTVISLLQSSL